MSFLEEVKRNKVVCIIRNINEKYILALGEALYKGGIRMVEVTFDQSSREGIENTLASIRLLSEKMGHRMAVGAGTVLTQEQVQAVFDVGGRFIITPNTNIRVIEKAKELKMGTMIGAMTPTEIELAYRNGADVVKIFPVVNLGIDYIHNIRGPMGYIPLSCVGGVGKDNIAAFFKAGCCSAGIGGSLVDKKEIEAGNFDKITKNAQDIFNSIMPKEQ